MKTRLALVLLAVLVTSLDASAQASAPTAAPGATTPVADSKPWHRLIGILQYLEADYPAAVESQSEFELSEQKAFIAEAVAAGAELGPRGATFTARLEALQTKVDASSEPEAVSAECGRLVEDLVAAGGLKRKPARTPDLALGATLYQSNCAVCHGVDGGAKVAIAENMEPKPSDFLSAELLEGLSPYKAFNTTSFGVPGTAMPAYPTLSEDERWSLAFFLFTLRQPPCDDNAAGTQPPLGLADLASATDGDLTERFGPDSLRCLRRKFPKTNTGDAFERARTGVQSALDAGGKGDFTTARQALLDAYLQGIEPVEPTLSSKTPATVQKLERLFLDARARAEKKDPSFEAPARELLTALDEAEDSLSVATPFSVFWVSFFILLREGFEAMIVVTALLAMLKKLGATDRAKIVHIGWVSALFAGVLAFFFARSVISGAQREWVEGIVALVAVAMLLYAVVWLNAKVNIRKHMGDLREKMQANIGKDSSFGLFFLAFTATFRESAETALFLQGLALDSVSGALWGGLAGLVALGGLVFMVSRVGFRLPMKTLFTASTVLLYATSVVLLGKGLRALQEVGAVVHSPIPFVHFDLLGLYPDAITLGAQAVLAAAPLVFWLWKKRGGSNVPGAGTSRAES